MQTENRSLNIVAQCSGEAQNDVEYYPIQTHFILLAGLFAYWSDQPP